MKFILFNNIILLIFFNIGLGKREYLGLINLKNSFNEIVINILNDNENIKILSDNFYDKNIPNEIIIDSIKKDEIKNNYNLSKGNHYIQIIWNKTITNCNGMFELKSISKIDFINFDSSSVVNMYRMFYGCSSLISLNLSNFNTSLVNDMGEMFSHCKSLHFLDLSTLNSSLVRSMRSMFYNCISLTSINLSNFKTYSVIKMEDMFNLCKSLISLNLSSFKTPFANDMSAMFEQCNSLRTLDISNFDSSLVTDISYMFYNCTSLTSLNISNFNTSSVLDMSDLFENCNSLESLDISHFNTKSLLIAEDTFSNLDSLKYLNILSYTGKDIFSSLNDINYIIYCYNEKSNNKSILSLISKNTINNCSFFYHNNQSLNPILISSLLIINSTLLKTSSITNISNLLITNSLFSADFSLSSNKIIKINTTNINLNYYSTYLLDFTTINNNLKSTILNTNLNNNIKKDKLNLIIIGIDNYKLINNELSFYFYYKGFFIDESFIMSKYLILNINLYILNKNIIAKKISCNLKGNNNNFFQYYCILNVNENEIINKVTINDNLYFGQKMSIDYIPLAKKMMDNINNQIKDIYSRKKLYLLYNSSLIHNEENFVIKGYIDNSDFDYSNNINIIIFNKENDEEIKIICSSKDKNNNNYEMICYNNGIKSFNSHLNKTLGETQNKLLLILFNEETEDLLYINNTANIDINSSSISKLAIIAITLSSLIILLLVFFIVIFIRIKTIKDIKNKNIGNINMNSSAKIND